jgi:arsenate reductase
MKGIVSFYGKPECRGNAEQKQLLREAGYLLEERDILTNSWDPAKLSNFFNGKSPRLFLNSRAPAIKSGKFNPDTMNDEEIVLAMIDDPILIKRPLIFFRGEFCCGFDTPLVSKLLGQDDKGDTDCKCKPA